MKATFEHQTWAPTELINDNTVTLSVKNFKACELCQTLWERALILQAKTPCAEEGLATRD